MHVTANSKEVKPGSIFFALQGAKFDGHVFIDDAIRAGATKIYSERNLGRADVEALGSNARKKLGELASEMHGHPTHTLCMVGVTGTSGKTTTSYLIHHLFTANGHRCARLGTNGAFFEGKEWPTANTTPDALSLQAWFREVKDLGATHVVMEVSSHALDQDRVWGIEWDSTVFLNLSPEHMDYHPTLDDYFAAKAKLFSEHVDYSRRKGKSPVLWTNIDQVYGKKLLTLRDEIKSYSVSREIRSLENTSVGLSASVIFGEPRFSFECPIFGSFQLENILAALSVAIGLGVSPSDATHALKTFGGVPGRMEFIANTHGIFVFVDYAHKPEALDKVLNAIQGKRIITVFGCGGDRDKTKRPVMGRIAAELSNHVVLTSDNPRTEKPQTILSEVEAGVRSAIASKTARIQETEFEIIEDRAKAIRRAISLAKSGDVVLIAGKGHEDYQIIGTEKRHFDDREEARKALNEL